MRILFKTSYLDDIRLFQHSGQVLWYSVLIACLLLAPLPARLAVRPPFGVIGRRTELAVITDRVEPGVAEVGQDVVVVSGEAGVGKTTLIAEVARGAFEDGACVLFGHCEEDLAAPYQLFTEALGHLVHVAVLALAPPVVRVDLAQREERRERFEIRAALDAAREDPRDRAVRPREMARVHVAGAF